MVRGVPRGLLSFVAHLQARLTGYPTTARSIAAVADAARPSTADAVKHVTAVLAARTTSEARVHRLAWQAARPDADARTEIEGLWGKADPESAAALRRQFAQIQAEVDGLRADGTP